MESSPSCEWDGTRDMKEQRKCWHRLGWGGVRWDGWVGFGCCGAAWCCTLLRGDERLAEAWAVAGGREKSVCARGFTLCRSSRSQRIFFLRLHLSKVLRHGFKLQTVGLLLLSANGLRCVRLEPCVVGIGNAQHRTAIPAQLTRRTRESR